MTGRDGAAYALLALLWGFSFLVLVKVVAAFGFVGAVSLRAFVAGATLIVVARLSGRRLRFAPAWRHFGVVGATTVAAQLLGLSYGTPLIGTAMAAILVATIPLFSMVIGQVWGLERMNAQGLAGLLLGACGLVLLVGFPAEAISSGFLAGCAATLGACFAAAFGSNYATVHLRTVGAWEVTIGAFLSGGVMTLPLLLVVPVPALPGMIDLLYLLIAGAGMSALTYVLYFGLVSRIGATRAISVEFAVTAVAVLVGAVHLGEAVTGVQIGGGLVIVLGCALVLGLLRLPLPARSGRAKD